MGCCLTTNNGGRNVPIGSESVKINESTPSENRAPPSIEEEKVIEVLSETPKLIKLEIHHEDEKEEDKQKKNIQIDPVPFPIDEGDKKEIKKRNFQVEDSVSEKENSEVCSLSISETVSTTTFDYDESEVKQRVRRSPAKLPANNRSISGDFGPRRDRIAGKSPIRRTEQSPDKRSNAGRGGCGSVKPGQIRESSVGRRGLRPDPYRRDPGEGSRRRSRSPATHSPSARRVNGSPGRVRIDLPDKRPSISNMGASSKTPNESLENPLVSLECFIFL